MNEELETHNLTKEEEELKRLLVPDVSTLPLEPPSAVQSNFLTYFAPGNPLTSYHETRKYTNERLAIRLYLTVWFCYITCLQISLSQAMISMFIAMPTGTMILPLYTIYLFSI